MSEHGGRLYDEFAVSHRATHGGSTFDEGFAQQGGNSAHGGVLHDQWGSPQNKGGPTVFDDFGWVDMPALHGQLFDSDFKAPTGLDGKHGTWWDVFQGAQTRFMADGQDWEGTVIEVKPDHAVVQDSRGGIREVGLSQFLAYRSPSIENAGVEYPATTDEDLPSLLNPTAHGAERGSAVGVGGIIDHARPGGSNEGRSEPIGGLHETIDRLGKTLRGDDVAKRGDSIFTCPHGHCAQTLSSEQASGSSCPHCKGALNTSTTKPIHAGHLWPGATFQGGQRGHTPQQRLTALGKVVHHGHHNARTPGTMEPTVGARRHAAAPTPTATPGKPFGEFAFKTAGTCAHCGKSATVAGLDHFHDGRAVGKRPICESCYDGKGRPGHTTQIGKTLNDALDVLKEVGADQTAIQGEEYQQVRKRHGCPRPGGSCGAAVDGHCSACKAEVDGHGHSVIGKIAAALDVLKAFGTVGETAGGRGAGGYTPASDHAQSDPVPGTPGVPVATRGKQSDHHMTLGSKPKRCPHCGGDLLDDETESGQPNDAHKCAGTGLDVLKTLEAQHA